MSPKWTNSQFDEGDEEVEVHQVLAEVTSTPEAGPGALDVTRSQQ